MVNRFLTGLFCALFVVGILNDSRNLTAQDATPQAGKEPSEKPVEVERTIYVPYAKLREVFEREGRGVFLPYEKFRELWDASHKEMPANVIEKSPHEALISDAESTATLKGDAFVVNAVYKIELFKKGWVKLPLRLPGTAILSAKIESEPARIVTEPDGSYQLVFDNTNPEKEDAANKTIQLDIVYAKAFTKSPGLNSVKLEPPPAPINRWTIRIPGPDAKVQVQPMLASTEVNEAENGDEEKDKPKDSTVIQAFVGATSQLQIDWTPKSEGALGMDAVVTVQSQQLATIEEGLQRTRANLIYTVSRSELSELNIKLPKDHKVINVIDANIRKWSVAPEGDDRQILTINLFEPTRKLQNVAIDLERYSDINAKEDQIEVVQLEAMNVARQQGTISIRSTLSDIRIEPIQQQGLLQTDAGEISAGINNSKANVPPNGLSSPALSFRYSSLPYKLSLKVTKTEPQIAVEQLSEIYLETNQVTADVHYVYQIKNAGVFQFSLNVPSDYQVVQVKGIPGAGIEAAAIDNFQYLNDAKDKLQINLSKKAIGQVGFVVQLQKAWDNPKATAESSKPSSIEFTIPRGNDASITRSRGHVIIYAPESLRVNMAKRGSFRDIPLPDAVKLVTSTRENRLPDLQGVISLEHADGEMTVSIQAERRKPLISARQLLAVRIEPGVVKYNAQFFYDVKYSGVPEFRIDLPKDVADKARVSNPAIRESVIEPPPSDLAADCIAWKFEQDQEWIGTATIQLTWESKLETPDIGKSLEIHLPRLVPRSVDRQWGQVVISKAESLDVQPSDSSSGVRPIDPQVDLFAEASSADTIRAFEFQEDWQLSIRTTRYALEEVKRTSIERALIQMVLTRSNQTTVNAMYRIRSARQRLAIDLPKNAEFDSQPLRINGQTIALERGDGDQLFIPLGGRDPNAVLVIELRYTLLTAPRMFEVPIFPEDPAIQKTFLGISLPAETVLMGTNGRWTEEFTWGGNNFLKHEPIPKQSYEQLVHWVKEGLSFSESPSFANDGTMYLFSTLNPSDGKSNGIRLFTLHESILGILVFLSVLSVGIFTLRRSWSTRITSVIAVISILIVLGVFLPHTASQILNLPFFAATACVILGWIAYSILNATRKPAVATVEVV